MIKIKQILKYSILIIILFNCIENEQTNIINGLKFTPQNSIYIVTAKSLHLREKPDKLSKSLIQIPFQTEIEIQEISEKVELDSKFDSWGMTKYKNKSGFVFLGFARPMTSLKSLRVFHSSNEKYIINELIQENSNQKYCGDWFAGYCITQIRKKSTNKIVYEKNDYIFKEFLDDDNIVLSFGGGENCTTAWHYYKLNLSDLKETNLFNYNLDTCENKNQNDDIKHTLCLYEICYTIVEKAEKILILKKENQLINSFEKVKSFEVNLKEWKNPEFTVDGNKILFSEILNQK